MALVVMNLPARVGDIRPLGWIPGLGRFPGGVHGNPLLLGCSCLENPLDGGVWWATVHRVAKSGTRLKRLSRQSRTNQGMRGKRWTGPNSEGLDPAVSGTIRAFFARQHNAQVCSQQKQGGYDGSNGDTGQCLCQDAEGKKMIQRYACNTHSNAERKRQLCLEKKKKMCENVNNGYIQATRICVSLPSVLLDFTKLTHVTKET